MFNSQFSILIRKETCDIVLHPFGNPTSTSDEN